MKPRHLLGSITGKFVFLLIILVSISTIFFLNITYEQQTITVQEGSYDFSCVVNVGPNNSSEEPSYQLDCTLDSLILFQDNLFPSTKYSISGQHNTSNRNYAPIVGFYVLDKTQFDGIPTDLFTHGELTFTSEWRNNTGRIQYKDTYQFQICICIEEKFSVSSIEYGLNFTNSIAYNFELTEATLYNQYKSVIIGYFVILLLTPEFIQQIRLYKWKKAEKENQEESLMEQVRKKHERK